MAGAGPGGLQRVPPGGFRHAADGNFDTSAHGYLHVMNRIRLRLLTSRGRSPPGGSVNTAKPIHRLFRRRLAASRQERHVTAHKLVEPRNGEVDEAVILGGVHQPLLHEPLPNLRGVSGPLSELSCHRPRAIWATAQLRQCAQVHALLVTRASPTRPRSPSEPALRRCSHPGLLAPWEPPPRRRQG